MNSSDAYISIYYFVHIISLYICVCVSPLKNKQLCIIIRAMVSAKRVTSGEDLVVKFIKAAHMDTQVGVRLKIIGVSTVSDLVDLVDDCANNVHTKKMKNKIIFQLIDMFRISPLCMY
jgi:hypothetical protein